MLYETLAIIYSGCIYIKYMSCLVRSPMAEQRGSTGTTIATIYHNIFVCIIFLVNLVSKIHIAKIGIAKITCMYVCMYVCMHMDDDNAVRQI